MPKQSIFLLLIALYMTINQYASIYYYKIIFESLKEIGLVPDILNGKQYTVHSVFTFGWLYSIQALHTENGNVQILPDVFLDEVSYLQRKFLEPTKVYYVGIMNHVLEIILYCIRLIVFYLFKNSFKKLEGLLFFSYQYAVSLFL